MDIMNCAIFLWLSCIRTLFVLFLKNLKKENKWWDVRRRGRGKLQDGSCSPVLHKIRVVQHSSRDVPTSWLMVYRWAQRWPLNKWSSVSEWIYKVSLQSFAAFLNWSSKSTTTRMAENSFDSGLCSWFYWLLIQLQTIANSVHTNYPGNNPVKQASSTQKLRT